MTGSSKHWGLRRVPRTAYVEALRGADGRPSRRGLLWATFLVMGCALLLAVIVVVARRPEKSPPGPDLLEVLETHDELSRRVQPPGK